MTYWSYLGYDGEQDRPAPIMVRLLGGIRSQDPDGQFLGFLPSKRHRKKSPWSIHNCGRALDWHPSSDSAGWVLAHTLAEYPDGAQLQLILWKDYQWGGRDGPGWRYTGRKDHNTHLHIETRGWS
jgi:hypothetical protein